MRLASHTAASQVQQQLVGFLPEVASPDEHERVVEALLTCVGGAGCWKAP